MPVAPEFLVDFLIGGTQKGGTTALAHFLNQHPEICLPAGKEAHFFDRPAYPDGADRATVARHYRAKFPDALRGRIVGEATPIYMYLPFVTERVHRYNPAMKWILLLREPVARAVSHYRMSRERGREWLPPGLAFHVEPWRLWWARGRLPVVAGRSSLRHHSYVDRGFYSAQIARIREWFPPEQVLVLTAENLRRQHEETLRVRCTRFSGSRTARPCPRRRRFLPRRRRWMCPPGRGRGCGHGLRRKWRGWRRCSGGGWGSG